MSNKRLLHASPVHGTTEWFIPSEDGESFTIETVQDVEPLIEKNKADLSMVSGSDRWGDGKLVARVPMVVWNDWKRKGWTQDETRLRALLNDPDNSWFRIWPGRI